MKASAKTNTAITCIFLDIGGVLLTNGWDHLARRRAAKHFNLKWAEMEAYRIRKFELGQFVDCFVSSCFIHIRKPDTDIFRLALDIAQAPARKVVYIENTPLFVQIAEGLGIRSILNTDFKSTWAKLASLGLQND